MRVSYAWQELADFTLKGRQIVEGQPKFKRTFLYESAFREKPHSQ